MLELRSAQESMSKQLAELDICLAQEKLQVEQYKKVSTVKLLPILDPAQGVSEKKMTGITTLDMQEQQGGVKCHCRLQT